MSHVPPMVPGPPGRPAQTPGQGKPVGKASPGFGQLIEKVGETDAEQQKRRRQKAQIEEELEVQPEKQTFGTGQSPPTARKEVYASPVFTSFESADTSGIYGLDQMSPSESPSSTQVIRSWDKKQEQVAADRQSALASTRARKKPTEAAIQAPPRSKIRKAEQEPTREAQRKKSTETSAEPRKQDSAASTSAARKQKRGEDTVGSMHSAKTPLQPRHAAKLEPKKPAEVPLKDDEASKAEPLTELPADAATVAGAGKKTSGAQEFPTEAGALAALSGKKEPKSKRASERASLKLPEAVVQEAEAHAPKRGKRAAKDAEEPLSVLPKREGELIEDSQKPSKAQPQVAPAAAETEILAPPKQKRKGKIAEEDIQLIAPARPNSAAELQAELTPEQTAALAAAAPAGLRSATAVGGPAARIEPLSARPLPLVNEPATLRLPAASPTAETSRSSLTRSAGVDRVIAALKAAVITLEQQPDRRTLTITLKGDPRLAGTALDGLQITVEEFASAPKQYNISLQSSAEAQALLSGAAASMAEQLNRLGKERGWQVQRLEVSLERPLFHRKGAADMGGGGLGEKRK
jgi:hypothetical protein